jgi:hypothetical protein
MKGNSAYYAYKGLMTFKLINKYTERKIYVTLRKSAVTYTCETWTLSVRDINI